MEMQVSQVPCLSHACTADINGVGLGPSLPGSVLVLLYYDICLFPSSPHHNCLVDLFIACLCQSATKLLSFGVLRWGSHQVAQAGLLIFLDATTAQSLCYILCYTPSFRAVPDAQ